MTTFTFIVSILYTVFIASKKAGDTIDPEKRDSPPGGMFECDTIMWCGEEIARWPWCPSPRP